MADVIQKLNCPQCGRQFTPWRGKRFCSEVCLKRDENKRRRAFAGEVTSDATGTEPVRGDDTKKAASRPLRGDETALGAGFSRIAGMLNPTIEAIRHELTGWNIEDERTIHIIAWRMKVAPTAVREALNG